MIGAIIGDIVGSKYEWHNWKDKRFVLFDREECRPTDDTVLTLAVAEALRISNGDASLLGREAETQLRKFGRLYPHAGYGGKFRQWLRADRPEPYGSFGNGAAMRVSPCGWAARSEREAAEFACAVTEVTHDHPDAVKAAEAVPVSVFLLRTGTSVSDLRRIVGERWYELDFTIDEIRPGYVFDSTCTGSVPQAFEAFFEAAGFEDAVRNAVSVGGDSDTIAAIAGSLAEAAFGVPENIRKEGLSYLDPFQTDVLADFEEFVTAFSHTAKRAN